MALRPGQGFLHDDGGSRRDSSYDGGTFVVKNGARGPGCGPLDGLLKDFQKELGLVETELNRYKQEQLRIFQEQHRAARMEVEAQEAKKRAERRLKREKQMLKIRQRNEEIVRRHSAGESTRSIATGFGISGGRVQQIVLKARRLAGTTLKL